MLTEVPMQYGLSSQIRRMSPVPVLLLIIEGYSKEDCSLLMIYRRYYKAGNDNHVDTSHMWD